jgi:hypothetical protein
MTAALTCTHEISLCKQDELNSCQQDEWQTLLKEDTTILYIRGGGRRGVKGRKKREKKGKRREKKGNYAGKFIFSKYYFERLLTQQGL